MKARIDAELWVGVENSGERRLPPRDMRLYHSGDHWDRLWPGLVFSGPKRQSMNEIIFIVEGSPEDGYDDYSLQVENLPQEVPEPEQQDLGL